MTTNERAIAQRQFDWHAAQAADHLLNFWAAHHEFEQLFRKWAVGK